MSYSDFRLYTSIPFAKWCDANNITVVGTLNEMRKGVPADFKVDFFLLTLHPGCTTKRKQSFIVLMWGGGATLSDKFNRLPVLLPIYFTNILMCNRVQYPVKALMTSKYNKSPFRMSAELRGRTRSCTKWVGKFPFTVGCSHPTTTKVVFSF
jgi:hypothetical protein